MVSEASLKGAEGEEGRHFSRIEWKAGSLTTLVVDPIFLWVDSWGYLNCNLPPYRYRLAHYG